MATPTPADTQKTDCQPNRSKRMPQRQAEGAANAKRRAHQGNRRSDLFPGQFVAHDADANRDQGGREALQGSPDNQRDEASGAEAATSEPAVIKTMHTSIISRFPYMSASLDTMGVATAAVSSVAVTNQEMSSAETCSRC